MLIFILVIPCASTLCIIQSIGWVYLYLHTPWFTLEAVVFHREELSILQCTFSESIQLHLLGLSVVVVTDLFFFFLFIFFLSFFLSFA